MSCFTHHNDSLTVKLKNNNYYAIIKNFYILNFSYSDTREYLHRTMINYKIFR